VSDRLSGAPDTHGRTMIAMQRSLSSPVRTHGTDDCMSRSSWSHMRLALRATDLPPTYLE
jgi:hypothetical protein